MNQPRSVNPALVRPGMPGAQPQAQPQQPPPQQPPQQQRSAGLVGPDGQPIQPEYIPLRLNPEGPAIPTTSMDGHELMGNLGGQVPFSMVITWVETIRALSQRDAMIAWLERRIVDLEVAMGRKGIEFEQFMTEMQQMMEQLQAQQQQQQQGQPPPQGQPQGQPPGMPPR